MKTFEIYYEATFCEVIGVEANSLEEAIENFNIDEALPEADLDINDASVNVLVEHTKTRNGEDE